MSVLGLGEDSMEKLLSSFVENIGIEFFKIANRKKSDSKIFQDCSYLDYYKLQSIYSNMQVFDSCKDYTNPALINTRNEYHIEINTFNMVSMYKPIGIFQNVYDSLLENKQIYFEEVKSVQSNNEEKACLIYLHGFSERSYALEAKYLFSRLIAEIPNIEILAVHLPYHMKRSPKNQPYSGAYIFDSYPIVTIEGFRQAVNDVSQVLSYAREKYKKVIVGGFSLGGYVTSFLGTCDNRGDLYVIGQAGDRLPYTLKNLTVCPGLYSKTQKWMKQGIDVEGIYAPLEIQRYTSIVSPEKVVSMAGKYDKLVAFESVIRLRDLFRSRHNINYSAGHIGFLFEAAKVKKEIMKLTGKFAT